MGLREDLLRKIEKKNAELVDAERQWERLKAGGEAYVQALQETLRALPRDVGEVKPEHILRPGGAIAKVRELIVANRKPLHVNEILQGLGKGADKKSRASVTSALGTYVRRGEIFVRTAPNTFGLLELGHSQARDEEPPADFGRPRPANLIPAPDDDNLASEDDGVEEDEF